jgi:hypothetical protein
VAYLTKGEKPARPALKLCLPGKGLMGQQGRVDMSVANQLSVLNARLGKLTMLTWTDRLDAKLLKLKKDGLSFAEIGERMGITRNAALGRFQRLNGVVFPSTLERRRTRAAAARLKKETRLKKEAELIRKMKAAIAAGTDKGNAMSQAHAAGATFVAIGEVFGISSVRAYQIANGR